jgi:beta-mannosidase
MTGGRPLSLWYPNGYGEQPLHNLTVTLCAAGNSSLADSACSAPWTAAVGLRLAELVQDPLPYTAVVNSSLGPSRTFYFRVNGAPVFSKGANSIPNDQFESRVTPALLWDYLTSAKAAHMTMFRMWGGGLYERDEFYEYCDQLGILLYHDCQFSDQVGVLWSVLIWWSSGLACLR